MPYCSAAGGVGVALDGDAALLGAAAVRAGSGSSMRGAMSSWSTRATTGGEVGGFVVMLVDADDGRVVAAADAGDVADLHDVGGAGVLVFAATGGVGGRR